MYSGDAVMTDLSSDQMAVVMGNKANQWEEVERPVGIQEIPDWLIGVHVDFMYGRGNAPHIYLKTRESVGHWPGMKYRKEGSKLFISESGDGRATALYHSGSISDGFVWRLFHGDDTVTHDWRVAEPKSGETKRQAAEREGNELLAKWHSDFFKTRLWGGKYIDPQKVELRIKELRMTAMQDGFGGRGFLIPMEDGTEMLLRGPWHGMPPNGYADVATVDQSYHGPGGRGYRKGRPWHQQGGSYGCYISEELLLKAVARFQSHIHFLRVKKSYGTFLEPYLPEWEGPKSAVMDVEQQRAINKEPAGQFWYTYWDSRGSYSGIGLRRPPNGFQPGVYGIPKEWRD